MESVGVEEARGEERAGDERGPLTSWLPSTKGQSKGDEKAHEAPQGAARDVTVTERVKEATEVAEARQSQEESRRVGMLEDPWWLGTGRSGSLGGVKIEEYRVDWVGAMEEGKRGRGPAEEEGVEAKEDSKEIKNKAEEGSGGGEGERNEKEDGAKMLFDYKESDTLRKTVPPEESRFKDLGTKVIDCPPKAHIVEPPSGSEQRKEQINEVGNEKIVEDSPTKCDITFEISRKCVGTDEVDRAEVWERKLNTVVEEELESDVEKEEVEEQDEKDEENERDEKEKVCKSAVSSYKGGKSLREPIESELKESKMRDVLEVEESDKRQRSDEKGEKSMHHTKGEFFSELGNEYPTTKLENTFGYGIRARGNLSKMEGSGEWKFVDTGGYSADNENTEESLLDVEDEQCPSNKYPSSTKGVFTGSFLSNRDNSQSTGDVGVGNVNDILQSFLNISKAEESPSIDVTNSKSGGEELYRVQMTLDEWEGEKRSDFMGPETEVVVEEFDLLCDWKGSEGTIGVFEVATKRQKGDNRKDEGEAKVERRGNERKCEIYARDYEKKDVKTSEDSFTENGRESSHDSSKESESIKSEDDENIEEFVRIDPDEWTKGGWTFMDTDNRSTFRNLEDMFGGEISLRMTASSTQFNLWPSQEAFGGKGTWTEHIDMDAYMSTAQSRQQPFTGTGLLRNVKSFAKSCTVGEQKPFSNTSEQYHFPKGDNDGAVEGKNATVTEEEEDIVLVERDFDDRSDENEDNIESDSQWGSTYHSFDISNPSAKRGDAFIIYESPSVTTFMAPEGEMSSDGNTDDKSETDKNAGNDSLYEEDILEGFDLEGEWEEGVIFLDDDDVDVTQIEGRRGSGEYRSFSGEIMEKDESELWGTLPLSNEDAGSGNMAFAVVMDAEERKEKTPVLPTGRWCPRLPLLSPAMSAISEEESEEALPDKEEKQIKSSEPSRVGMEAGEDGAEQNRNKESENENNPEDSFPPEPSSGVEIQQEKIIDKNEEIDEFKVTQYTDRDEETFGRPGENLKEKDIIDQLPKLDVEVEDGFGELFTRRRSSTSSVVSDSGVVEPVADCGAAFVVSSELAVTLALGVSITQIIPPVIDLPEISPLPKVEKATDALNIDEANEKPEFEHCKVDLNGHRVKNLGRIQDGEQQQSTDVGKKVENASCPIADGKDERENQIRKNSTEPMTGKKLSESQSGWLAEKGKLSSHNLTDGSQGDNSKKKWENNEISKSEERLVDLERSKGEGDRKDESVNDIVNNITGAIKRTLRAAAEGMGEEDLRKNENHRDLTLTTTKKEFVEKNERIKIETSVMPFPGEVGTISSCEQECDWYEGEGEGIEYWSNGRLVTKTVLATRAEQNRKIGEKGNEGIFENKQRGSEMEMRLPPTEETGEGKSEPTKSSSPPGGVRKKESLEEKTESPPRVIPLEKLLGWSSENGNGNGLGCSGVSSRRESVFDDYNFSLWENGFQLNKNTNNQRIKSQDSTGLEYYLDVDQLLNVPLAATEPEVKYVSAKEIMDTFSRGEGMDSPEKKLEEESEKGTEKTSTTSGVACELLDTENVGEAAGISNERVGAISQQMQELDLFGDDLFADFSRGSVFPVTYSGPESMSQMFSVPDDTSHTSPYEYRKGSPLTETTEEENIKMENKIDESCVIEMLSSDDKTKKDGEDSFMNFGMELCDTVKVNETENTRSQKLKEEQQLSIKESASNTGVEKESRTSGGKVRNIIDIFEHPSISTMNIEIPPAKEEKLEKYSPSLLDDETTSGDSQNLPSVLGASTVGEMQSELQTVVKKILTETEEEMERRTQVDSSLPSPPLVPEGEEAGTKGEVEVSVEQDVEEKEAALSDLTAEDPTRNCDVAVEGKELEGKEADSSHAASLTNNDKRDALLSLPENPVVGWEAIKVASDVEKIILSTGNGEMRRKKIMGGIVIGAEPDKIFEAIQQSAECSPKDQGFESKKDEDVGEKTVIRELSDLRISYEPTTAAEWNDFGPPQTDSKKPNLRHADSFEDCRTVVSEAYQFLENLGDTIDEDEEGQTEEGGMKERGGKVDISVCGTGSEVEEFHPCEEFLEDRRETIPRAVESAPLDDFVEGQSSPSSPENSKTTESSSSSSPYSSLPTFADVSSGILSSTSSKDENYAKMEDEALRKELAYKSDFCGTPAAEAERPASDGVSVLPGDYPADEIDSNALANMNVASRKEYWDRRLQRVQEKSKEVATAGAKKPSPLMVSGIVARGRMSFEKSRDESSTSDSGGDGGKSSSESSPSWRGRAYIYRPKPAYCKGAKSLLPSKKDLIAKVEEPKFPLEEKEITKTLEELSSRENEKSNDDERDKEIRKEESDIKQAEELPKQTDDIEDLSQKPVLERKEIWDQKLQKMSEDESPPSSLEYRRTGRKTSGCGDPAKKLLKDSSNDDKTEKNNHPIRGKSAVTIKGLGEQSLSIESLSLTEKTEPEEFLKKNSPIKTTGSVSRLAKLFSSPAPEPPPPKYGPARPIHKGKYSKSKKNEAIKDKEEPTEKISPRTGIPTKASSQVKIETSHSAKEISETVPSSAVQKENNSLILPIEGKDKKTFAPNANISTIPSSKTISDPDSNPLVAENDSSRKLASRRRKYLESVQQSTEAEENRREFLAKKSESEESIKEQIGRKGITEVRNIWEKRASLDGSDSTSESIKKVGKTSTKSASSNAERKKYPQGETSTTKGKMGSLENTNEMQLEGDIFLKETEARRQVDSPLEKPISQAEQTFTASSTRCEIEWREGNTLSSKAISRHGAFLEETPSNDSPVPSTDKSIGKRRADSSLNDSAGLREKKPGRPRKTDPSKPSDTDHPKQIIQSTKNSSQHSCNVVEDDEREVSNVNSTEKALQVEKKVFPEERSSEKKSTPQERRAPRIKDRHESSSPPETDDLPTEEASSGSPGSFNGQRHSSAAANPPQKMNVSKMREKWGSLEGKAIETAGSRGKRDSLEIRVTDDEDICVLRQVTSVPRFPSKEKMETHEEEERRHADGEVAAAPAEVSKPVAATSPSATGAKKKPIPPRTVSIQVSGIVASGRRRFEVGKVNAEDMPTLSEEHGEKEIGSQAPRNLPVGRKGATEERQKTPTLVEDLIEEKSEEEVSRPPAPSRSRRGGDLEAPRDEAGRLRAPEAGGKELYRAVPVCVTVVEEEHRGTDIRVEVCEVEGTSPTSKGEGGDDGRSATSRRVPKGRVPAQKQPPPSATSSPDTESEGATDNKLLSFLATPASQIRRHSAVDVATLRSFNSAEPEGPQMRRRGSGDLGSPIPPKGDESKKRFTRARQFFETLEKTKERPTSPPQSGAEEAAPPAKPPSSKKKKKKQSKEEEEKEGRGDCRGSVGRRSAAAKHHSQAAADGYKDSSESTAESDKEKKHRRKTRRSASEKTHSAPGSDVESSSSASVNHPSLHRRRRDKDLVLRSQRFGGSEREVKVSERFNVMDLFRDVVGPGAVGTIGRATPLGIPHQAAVLAALRSVEDVRSSATRSPYDMYRPVEADNDCEPTAIAAAADERETVASANDENANVEEDCNVTFASPMTLCVKKEYQAEYPHLPISSPRQSRHRSPNTDLIPRNVLLQLEPNPNPPKKSSSARRSIAELF